MAGVAQPASVLTFEVKPGARIPASDIYGALDGVNEAVGSDLVLADPRGPLPLRYSAT